MQARPYDRLASIYDLLAAIYSGGAIHRAKRLHVDALAPGGRVLYAGAGTAAEGVLAAQRGAEVTLLDASARMLARAEARFQAHGQRARLIRDDVLAPAHAWGTHDVVVAPFFLNVFAARVLPGVLQRLAGALAPGGSLVIVDFAAPSTNRFLALAQHAYYLPALLLFRVLAGNPWHSLYDYRMIIAQADLPFCEPTRPMHATPFYSSQTWRKLA